MFSKERFKSSWNKAPGATMLFFVIPMIIIALFAGVLFGKTLKEAMLIFVCGSIVVFLFSYGPFLFWAIVLAFREPKKNIKCRKN